ncbi:hypothetical protein ANN_11845 [Periplaneta americana]|uniref:Uncharacterized protein n=1 Tax=Periplaneta americana TaxID=6978 RepID=A0ABQ8T7A7_PERAM|nr:hypothetical protein ANN_11845 [Periplaneta americana]
MSCPSQMSGFYRWNKFKYLGATVTNINDTREEIKRRINMGNACYYSVEKLLSSSLLSKNLKVRIYKTVKTSPDLNPTEHLWDELDRRLRSRETRPTSNVQLSVMLQEEWRRIPVDILHKLVESMPDRVAAVIATRGGTTRLHKSEALQNEAKRVSVIIVLPRTCYTAVYWVFISVCRDVTVVRVTFSLDTMNMELEDEDVDLDVEEGFSTSYNGFMLIELRGNSWQH